MSLRVRANGALLCAAKHPALPDDIRYIDDGLHYMLGVEQGVLIPDDDEDTTGRWHWRNKGEPFRHGYITNAVEQLGYDREFWGKDQPHG